MLTVSTEGAAEAKTMGEGLMTLVTATIRDLGLVVDKAVVDPSNKNVLATFYVTDFDQKKVRAASTAAPGVNACEQGAALSTSWLELSARTMRYQTYGGRGSDSHTLVLLRCCLAPLTPQARWGAGGWLTRTQLTDVEDLTNIRICIATVVDQEVGGKMLAATPTPAAPEANAVEVAALTEKEKVCHCLVCVCVC